jgi:hypothetical protein
VHLSIRRTAGLPDAERHSRLEPDRPGISGGSQAGNFAKPLEASGFIAGIVPFRDGFRIQFSYANPNAKVVGTGVFVVIGQVDGKPLYLELIQPDPSFPGFQRCPRLATG